MSWWNIFSWFKKKHPQKSNEELLIEKVSEVISKGNTSLDLKYLPELVEDIPHTSEIDDMEQIMLKKNMELKKKHLENVKKIKEEESSYVPVFVPFPSYESPSIDMPSFDAGGGESGGGGSSDSF